MSIAPVERFPILAMARGPPSSQIAGSAGRLGFSANSFQQLELTGPQAAHPRRTARSCDDPPDRAGTCPYAPRRFARKSRPSAPPARRSTGLDPGQQGTRLVGLGDVVIGPGLEDRRPESTVSSLAVTMMIPMRRLRSRRYRGEREAVLRRQAGADRAAPGRGGSFSTKLAQCRARNRRRPVAR